MTFLWLLGGNTVVPSTSTSLISQKHVNTSPHTYSPIVMILFFSPIVMILKPKDTKFKLKKDNGGIMENLDISSFFY